MSLQNTGSETHQFEALEAPDASEGVLTVEVAQKPQQIVEAITRELTG